MKRLNPQNVNTGPLYDAMYQSYRRDEMRAVVPLQVLLPGMIRNSDTVLDVGCGYGQYHKYLKRAQLVIGVDFAAATTAEAAKCGYNNVLTADFAEHLPFPEQQFTVVFCSEVLEHMDNPQRLLEECFRVLTASGLLILTTPYRDSINIVEHVWAYEESDLRSMLSLFSQIAIFRYSVHPDDLYEHFCVLARK